MFAAKKSKNLEKSRKNHDENIHQHRGGGGENFRKFSCGAPASPQPSSRLDALMAPVKQQNNIKWKQHEKYNTK